MFVRPTPQWSLRWNPDQGWEVIGPKPVSTNLDSLAWHIVVPLYLGEYHAKRHTLTMREEIVRELERGQTILTDRYHGGEEERIEQVEGWIEEFTERFKPTSQERSEIERGVYPGAWGHTD